MSNAGEIKKQMLSFMEDGQEWTVEQISSRLKNINPDWTRGMISGSITSLLDSNQGFTRVKYGVYKYTPSDNLPADVVVKKKLSSIISDTEQQIKNAVSGYNILEVNEKTLETIRTVNELLEMLDNFKKKI